MHTIEHKNRCLKVWQWQILSTTISTCTTTTTPTTIHGGHRIKSFFWGSGGCESGLSIQWSIVRRHLLQLLHDMKQWLVQQRLNSFRGFWLDQKTANKVGSLDPTWTCRWRQERNPLSLAVEDIFAYNFILWAHHVGCAGTLRQRHGICQRFYDGGWEAKEYTPTESDWPRVRGSHQYGVVLGDTGIYLLHFLCYGSLTYICALSVTPFISWSDVSHAGSRTQFAFFCACHASAFLSVFHISVFYHFELVSQFYHRYPFSMHSHQLHYEANFKRQNTSEGWREAVITK